MSRFARSTCCAVVVMLGLVLSAQMSAEEQADDPFGQSVRGGSYKSAEERIEAALNQPLKAPLDFTELPLTEIVNTLQDEYDIPILFDYAALDEVAISPETEITVNLRNITLRSALKLMLQQPGVEDLAYVIDDEVLLITTIDRANSTLQVRLYRIDDLQLYADPPQEGAAGWADFRPVVRVIISCVESQSWQVNGEGVGEIILIRPGVLVVTTTRRVHKGVEKLLAQLRELKTEIERDTTRRLGQNGPALAE